MPRDGSIAIINVAGNSAYQMTAAGIEQLRQLATVGTPIKAIAEFFDVSDDWLRAAIVGDPDVRTAYQSAKGDGELELRTAAHEAAKAGDSRVLTFMMERRLKMNKEVEHTHNHNVKVIGAVPDYKLSHDQWMERFAPPSLPAPGVSPITDAEYSEVGDDSGQAGTGRAGATGEVRKPVGGEGA